VGGKRVNGKLFNYVNHEYNAKCDYDVCVSIYIYIYIYIYMAIIVLKFFIYFYTCIKMNKYKKSWSFKRFN